MATGLEIYDETGTIRWVESTDRIGRIGVSDIISLSPNRSGFIDVSRYPNEKIMVGLLVTGTVIATAGIVDASNPNVLNHDGGRIIYSWQSGTGSAYLIFGRY